MKKNSNYRQLTARGFTLMELMVVVTIIIILAGITVVAMNSVNARSSLKKAQVQLKLLESAIEEYKLDRGSYPKEGTNGAQSLFEALYWDTDEDGQNINNDDDQKIYLAELDPNSKQSWTIASGSSYKIIDPWNKEWNYYVRQGDNDPKAKNPDFDLWSSGPDSQWDDIESNKLNKDNIVNW